MIKNSNENYRDDELALSQRENSKNFENLKQDKSRDYEAFEVPSEKFKKEKGFSDDPFSNFATSGERICVVYSDIESRLVSDKDHVEIFPLDHFKNFFFDLIDPKISIRLFFFGEASFSFFSNFSNVFIAISKNIVQISYEELCSISKIQEESNINNDSDFDGNHESDKVNEDENLEEEIDNKFGQVFNGARHDFWD